MRNYGIIINIITMIMTTLQNNVTCYVKHNEGHILSYQSYLQKYIVKFSGKEFVFNICEMKIYMT